MSPVGGRDDTSFPWPSGRLRAHLLKGSAGSFVLQVVYAGFAFLNAIVLARMLGTEGYGAFANAIGWISLLSVPATFGFATLLIRDIAIYRSKKDWELLRGLLRFSDKFVFLASLLLALIAAASVCILYPSQYQATMRRTVLISLIMVPILSAYNLREAAICGLEYVIRARFPGMVVRPAVLFCGVITLYLVWPGLLSAPMAMGVNVLGGGVALVLAISSLRKLLPVDSKFASAKYERRTWLMTAVPMLVYSGSQIVLGQSDIVMLGAMRGAHEVGQYAAASRISQLLMFIPLSTEIIAAPVISRLYSRGDTARLQRVVTVMVRSTFAAALPFGTVLFFMGSYVLGLFGRGFIVADPALRILVVGKVFAISMGSGSLLMGMIGRERALSVVVVCMAILNITLNAAIIPQYGLYGAAVATILSMAVSQVVLVAYLINRVGFDVSIFGFPVRSG